MNIDIDFSRDIVLHDYQSACIKNAESFHKGNVKTSSEYIFSNQKEDAAMICNKFYTTSVKAISIIKRTKVGMDGLMIEIAKNMTTHPDNNFVLNRNNIFFITAMSNKLWEKDMKDKMPACFRDNVYHHGKLQQLKLKLTNLKNAIIINDEIDNGDKEDQKLHKLLKDSGILDIKYMEDNNIRFVFVSATMINELQLLDKWGDNHFTYYMTIPQTYIGHKEFLELGIIQEYYEIKNDETAEKWVQEDIIQNYGTDYRVHIIRTDIKNKKFISNSCIKNKIDFKNHTSNDRISDAELSTIFNNITNHLVIAVKGFFRRANLIPNSWKLKIGATHEKCVKTYDTNVQVQGLPGRMTGYWKSEILNGHKTGPHRTSIEAMKEYEKFYTNPFGDITYNTSGNKKLFVDPKNIKNLEVIEPIIIQPELTKKRVPIIIEGLIETDIIFTTKKQKEKINFIKTKLESMENEGDEIAKKLLNFINTDGVKCGQITKPGDDNSSYKKHIIDVVNAKNNNTPFIIDLKPKLKEINNWQVFIDTKEKRLCVVIWSIDETLY
jgi:hypothetical protein